MCPTPLRALRVALLALALVAALPTAASAAAFPVPAPASALTAATTVAQGHWGRQACGGQVAVTWEHLGRRVNAESRWSAPAGGDATTYFNCRVAFSYDVGWSWPKFCTIVEHELGHLNGHAHDDADDLMSPDYLAPSPECAAARTPAGVPTARAAARAKRSR